jgi:hypothetical protein
MREKKKSLLSGPGEVKTGPLKVNIIYYNVKVRFLRFYGQGKEKLEKRKKTSLHFTLTSNI